MGRGRGSDRTAYMTKGGHRATTAGSVSPTPSTRTRHPPSPTKHPKRSAAQCGALLDLGTTSATPTAAPISIASCLKCALHSGSSRSSWRKIRVARGRKASRVAEQHGKGGGVGGEKGWLGTRGQAPSVRREPIHDDLGDPTHT
eukprot:scaffold1761_cov108-Isochrysis_galbana.AAC.3